MGMHLTIFDSLIIPPFSFRKLREVIVVRNVPYPAIATGRMAGLGRVETPDKQFR